MDLLAVNNRDFQAYYHDPQDIAAQVESSLSDEWRLT